MDYDYYYCCCSRRCNYCNYCNYCNDCYCYYCLGFTRRHHVVCLSFGFPDTHAYAAARMALNHLSSCLD